jgi:anti-anti-sigma regulatory factor
LDVLLLACAALGALDQDLLIAAPTQAARRMFELAGLQHKFRLATEPG